MKVLLDLPECMYLWDFRSSGARGSRRPLAQAARPAALGPDVGQSASAQPAESLTEPRGQPIAQTHRPSGGALARLQLTLPGAGGWGLVAAMRGILLCLHFSVNTFDQAMLQSSTTRGRTLTPGAGQPLGAGLCVAALDVLWLLLFVTLVFLWTSDDPLLLSASAHLRALPPGGGVPVQAGLEVTERLRGRPCGHCSAVERS